MGPIRNCTTPTEHIHTAAPSTHTPTVDVILLYSTVLNEDEKLTALTREWLGGQLQCRLRYLSN